MPNQAPSKIAQGTENLKDVLQKFDVNLGGGSKRADGIIEKASGAVDDTNKIPEIEIEFNRNPKHDAAEFARQLENQQKGMNELTVQEYLDNRTHYIAEGRAIEGNAAQQAAREKALSNKIEELFGQGMSWESAEKEATSWMDSQAALHNPDQIAGGNASIIGGMGDKGINSSLGAQWKYRIDTVDEQIREMAKNMTPEQLKNTYLNVKLTQ
ncbi:polymorphic toxin type 15 domain-containing protein [Listeria sp. ILCC797]|uniref:polymorphic toxin type 15 domain-containing protein n=1 Tax=Listeria sp. ILCC797 TaxID=1918333 RepID=UPI0021012BCE|nr:polymorphic toxin type 15 domain-containing protein [Listeria sp. ILCC797]